MSFVHHCRVYRYVVRLEILLYVKSMKSNQSSWNCRVVTVFFVLFYYVFIYFYFIYYLYVLLCFIMFLLCYILYVLLCYIFVLLLCSFYQLLPFLFLVWIIFGRSQSGWNNTCLSTTLLIQKTTATCLTIIHAPLIHDCTWLQIKLAVINPDNFIYILLLVL